MGQTATFLIVEPQALVQMDLTQVLLEACPGARVEATGSIGAAGEMLEGLGRLTGAIVGTGAQSLKESGLGRRIEERGGWIICLNGRHTETIRAEGWHPLVRPFAADDAQLLVRSLLGRPSVAAAR